MDAPERDVWSSNDTDSQPQTAAETSRPKSQSFLDDDIAINGGWGLPTPSTSTTVMNGDLGGSEAVEGSNHLKDKGEDTATTSTSTPPPTTSSALPQPPADHADDDGEDEDEFADFDDTSPGDDVATTLEPSVTAQQDDDDFGDFGDFPEEGQAGVGDLGFGDEDDGFGEEAVTVTVGTHPQPSSDGSVEWPRFVASGSGSQSVTAQIQTILSTPLYTSGPEEPFGAGQIPELTQERIRQAEGPAQILVGESSRRLYSDLASAPNLKPVDWLRSRTRRDLHISLGVPINLDEIMYVDSPSSSSPGGGANRRLPPLAIDLNNGSERARQGGREAAHGRAPLRQDSSSSSSSAGLNASNGAGKEGSSVLRSQSRDQGNKERMAEKRREALGLGPMPEVDMRRVEQVCNLSEDQLSLLTLPSLRSLSQELSHLTSSTSLLLTHHLTLRESLQSDSEMYNGLIKDLVTGAANRLGDSKGGSKAGVSRQGSGRRFGPGSTTTTAAAIGSGRNSPRPASPFSMGPKR